MRYLSVCSGIEAATVAWHSLGWKPVGFSEIEKFPCQVLKHHYPNVPNFGSLTEHGAWPLQVGSIDLLVGGTPCQSFSVAGLRKGMSDPRGNLALTFLGLADRLKPKWIVWENVPGVLSSSGGRDFGSFLGALAELGYGFAYRVLDAQYFGVAQRRRRVFVVGCLGDWASAAAVLFERESVQRNPAPRREARKEAAAPAANGVGTCGADDNQGQPGHLIAQESGAWPASVAPTLNATFASKRGLENQHALGGAGHFVPHTPAIGFNARQDPVSFAGVTGALDADAYTQAVAIGTDCYNGAITGDVAATIGTPGSSVNASGPTVMQAVAFANRTRNGIKVPEVMKDGVTPALTNPGNGGRSDAINVACVHAVAQPIPYRKSRRAQSVDEAETWVDGDVANTINLFDQGDVRTTHAVVQPMMAVRRLTPVECERLQGFPDGYTDIRPRGKDTPDGPRYKALGNSMAVPVMRWIGERIARVETR